MEPNDRILLTVISEATLEEKLTKAIRAAGASGYTVSDVRGMGHRGLRSGEFEHTGNIKIEILCNSSTSENIIDFIMKKFFKDYGIVLFTSRVSVLRSEKFL